MPKKNGNEFVVTFCTESEFEKLNYDVKIFFTSFLIKIHIEEHVGKMNEFVINSFLLC